MPVCFLPFLQTQQQRELNVDGLSHVGCGCCCGLGSPLLVNVATAGAAGLRFFVSMVLAVIVVLDMDMDVLVVVMAVDSGGKSEIFFIVVAFLTMLTSRRQYGIHLKGCYQIPNFQYLCTD